MGEAVKLFEIELGEDLEEIRILDKKTIRQGIEETIQYLAFLSRDKEDGYILDKNSLGTGYEGILVTQDHNKGTKYEEQKQEKQSIKILKASELKDEDYLRDIISQKI